MTVPTFARPTAPPPELPDGTLRVVALGGLGEVGRNMAVLEYGGQLLVIDCGVLFPEEGQPGVDVILPDFTWIADRLQDVQAVVLTHGHEDHIGAVPYLLRLRPDLPVVGSRLTLALVEAKLVEHGIAPVLRVVTAGETVRLREFSCEFVAVNHSIPDALAVAVTTGAGTVLHTGDFKMDQLPLDGRVTDLAAFARLGATGVDLFMVDSTNAEVPGFLASEREIGPVLDAVFASSHQRIVVSSFASHVHRVQQVLDAAARHGRRVAFVGRSMVRNMGLAAELGYLHVPDGLLVDATAAEALSSSEVVLMCTGSQGEPMAALSRIARGEHKVRVGPGDTVILASSLIPGNENSVFAVINGLTRLGARVVHGGNAKVHVSGHASAGELLTCYTVVRPKNVMPVHGEPRHLVANAGLAIATGVPPERVVLVEDGVVVDLRDGIATVVGAVPSEHVYVDGSSVGLLSSSDLKDRLVLAEEGFVSFFVVVDEETGLVAAGPQVVARGFAEDEAVFTDIRAQIVTDIEAVSTPGAIDVHLLQQTMRRAVGRWVWGSLRRRPMIVSVVTAV